MSDSRVTVYTLPTEPFFKKTKRGSARRVNSVKYTEEKGFFQSSPLPFDDQITTTSLFCWNSLKQPFLPHHFLSVPMKTDSC